MGFDPQSFELRPARGVWGLWGADAAERDHGGRDKVYGWRSRWYQRPDLPPRSAGAAGPTGTNPALTSTLWDAVLSWEVAARRVRRPCRAAAVRHSSWTALVA